MEDHVKFKNSEINITKNLIKKWAHLVFMFPSKVMVLKLSKKVHFLWFRSDHSKKSVKSNLHKSIWKALFRTSRKCYCLLCYYTMTYCVRNFRVWIQRILLKFCWVSIFLDILIANILWAVVQAPVNHRV